MALVVVAVGWVVQPAIARAQTVPTPAGPTTLNGAVAGNANAMALSWSNAFATTAAPVTLQTSTTGTELGRQSFIDQGLDFVISGVPFTADQMAQLDQAGKSLIDVPIEGVGLDVAAWVPPNPTGFQMFPSDCDENPDCFALRKTYAAPMRFTRRPCSGRSSTSATSGRRASSSRAWTSRATTSSRSRPGTSGRW